MPAQLPTVVLRHDLPDGSHHFDWLLANDPDGASPLTTFRMPRPVHELEPGAAMEALRLPDHRPRYLEYEGPLDLDRGVDAGQGRGAVRRMARGKVTVQVRGPESWRFEVEWEGGGGGQRIELRQQDDDRWQATCVRVEPSHR